MSWGKLWEMVSDREAWSRKVGHDLVTEQQQNYVYKCVYTYTYIHMLKEINVYILIENLRKDIEEMITLVVSW